MMKLLFSTLLCHRDVETFIFNWFCCRLNLDNGFDIPHLILNDGTLTPDDINKLSLLTKVFIETEPVKLYNVPKPQYLAKLKGLEVGFIKYNAERVVILDPDVFFIKPWDSDLVNILMSENIAMMDFGSSLGPNQEQYKKLYGVLEDELTPTCNTGIFSTTRKYYDNILVKLIMHLNDTFLIMEDQGILFAASYGNLSYIKNIKIAVNGAEYHQALWNWLMSQNGIHLVGMRTRKEAYYRIVDSINVDRIPVKRIKPINYRIKGGILSLDVYDFRFPYANYPGKVKGQYVTDAFYMSGDSRIEWVLPPQINRFEASIMMMDDSMEGKSVRINNVGYKPGNFYIMDINKQLIIETDIGEKVYYAFTFPKFHVNMQRPSTEFQ